VHRDTSRLSYGDGDNCLIVHRRKPLDSIDRFASGRDVGDRRVGSVAIRRNADIVSADSAPLSKASEIKGQQWRPFKMLAIVTVCIGITTSHSA
jgi:hypothetical protein